LLDEDPQQDPDPEVSEQPQGEFVAVASFTVPVKLIVVALFVNNSYSLLNWTYQRLSFEDTFLF